MQSPYLCEMEWKRHVYQFDGWEKHLERIRDKKATLDALRPLPGYAVKKIRESLAIEWTYHSNSIEGNTLTLRETQMVIEDGLTVHGKTLREHFEAVNHHEAIEFVEGMAATAYTLHTGDILAVHALVLQKIEKEFAGRYRNSGVRISGANFVPPNALKVDVWMEDLIAWVNGEGAGLHPVVRATIFHHRFVWIHPFFDGNGRTARLLTNLLLMKEGFPPAIILTQDRKKYYDALNKANQGHYGKLLLLTMQALERSLDIYLSNLTNTYDDYRPVSDVAEDPGIPYQAEYLSLLARQGKIDAFKEGKNWLTTAEAIRQYMEKRERKRVVG